MIEAPYRDGDGPAPRTLTADERSQLAAAGRRLALGAWLGVIATFAAAAWIVVLIHPPSSVLALLVPLAILPMVWLQRARRAARSLAELGDAGADYRNLAVALLQLRIAFLLRGGVCLALVAAAFVMLFADA